MAKNWSSVQAKVGASVWTLLRRQLFLKSKAEVCTVYIFSLTFYRLSVLPLSNGRLEGIEAVALLPVVGRRRANGP